MPEFNLKYLILAILTIVVVVGIMASCTVAVSVMGPQQPAYYGEGMDD